VVGTKSLTDVAKPSEIVSLFMDDEELAESVAKRKQAEAHGYVAPSINPVATSKGLGDNLNLGGGDEDEDDFFSLKRKVVNGEDEDEPVPGPGPGAAVAASGAVKAEGGKKTKRKAEGEREFFVSWISWDEELMGSGKEVA
jgi:DNA helicase INO80